MQLPDEVVRQLLLHFSRLTGRKLSCPRDLTELPSRTLLELARKLPDNFLPALVSLLKGAGEGVFLKLLGEHEEENRELSQEFFRRYCAIVLEPEETSRYNALFLVESRRSFFLRQEIEAINEWMWELFGLGPFAAAAQEEAWDILWDHLLRSRNA
jgi:hypothetical protein